MAQIDSAAAIDKVRAIIGQASGLDVSSAAAQRAVREHMRNAGLRAFDDSAILAWVERIASEDVAALLELVVVPESWMFRDAGAFTTATARVAQRVGEGRGPQRILSLPCAGGEEPYSMAMALADAQVPPSAWRIDAIDLSSVALARAREGWYGRNAFRGADLAFRQRHFSAEGNGFRIDPALRGQVKFMQGNLLDLDVTANAGRYDIIFCRNLLIYFDRPTVAAASEVLRAMLADDGMLLAGYAEVPQLCVHGFHSLRIGGAFALQKTAPLPAPTRTMSAVARVCAAPVPAPANRTPTAAAAQASENPAALLAAARQQADSGDSAAASASCQRLLAMPALPAPAQADAYYLLGLLADAGQDPGAAAEHWRRCVYLRPDHYEALCRLALLAKLQGDAAGAARLRQRAARVFAREQQPGDH